MLERSIDLYFKSQEPHVMNPSFIGIPTNMKQKLNPDCLWHPILQYPKQDHTFGIYSYNSDM